MRISDLTPPEDVILDVNINDKSQALKLVAEELAIDRAVDPERVRAALAAREQLGSTGIGHGIALPRVCLPELDACRARFVRAMPPVGLNAVDGKPVVLVAISCLPKDKGTASELCQARSASSVSKIFRRIDGPATSALS